LNRRAKESKGKEGDGKESGILKKEN